MRCVATRSAVAHLFGGDASQGPGSKLDDVYVGVRGDHLTCYHVARDVARFLGGAKGGNVGQKTAVAHRIPVQSTDRSGGRRFGIPFLR